jgi:hypothetical protein
MEMLMAFRQPVLIVPDVAKGQLDGIADWILPVDVPKCLGLKSF